MYQDATLPGRNPHPGFLKFLLSLQAEISPAQIFFELRGTVALAPSLIEIFHPFPPIGCCLSNQGSVISMFEVQQALLVSFIYVVMCYKICICVHIFSFEKGSHAALAGLEFST